MLGLVFDIASAIVTAVQCLDWQTVATWPDICTCSQLSSQLLSGGWDDWSAIWPAVMVKKVAPCTRVQSHLYIVNERWLSCGELLKGKHVLRYFWGCHIWSEMIFIYLFNNKSKRAHRPLTLKWNIYIIATMSSANTTYIGHISVLLDAVSLCWTASTFGVIWVILTALASLEHCCPDRSKLMEQVLNQVNIMTDVWCVISWCWTMHQWDCLL